jgi:hypothetical protein
MDIKDIDVPLPRVIYRYFHPASAGFLRVLSIRFANPATFNDPFEGSPRFDLFAERRAKEAVEECMIRNARLGLRLPESRVFLEDCKNRMLPGRIKDHSERFRKEYGEKFRVLCFSENIGSPLMWGHYSSSQTGFALGFDTAHQFFRGRLAKVHYDPVRPDVGDPRIGMLIPLIKNHEWSYEQEWRIFQPVKSPEPYYELLPAPCIKAIYFALRIQSTTRLELESSLRLPNLAHIEKFEMEIHQSDYRLLPIPARRYELNDEAWKADGI